MIFNSAFPEKPRRDDFLRLFRGSLEIDRFNEGENQNSCLQRIGGTEFFRPLNGEDRFGFSPSNYLPIQRRGFNDRERFSFTRSQLDSHHNFVGEVESGNMEISAGSLLKVSRALGLEINQLVRGLK